MQSKLENLIRENLMEIIPELENVSFTNDTNLIELGANSVDRGELITLTLERLDLDISRIEFYCAKTITELANLIKAKAGANVI